jgi:hypothetical protein
MTPSTKGPLTSPTPHPRPLSGKRAGRPGERKRADAGRVHPRAIWLLPSSWDRWAELFEEAGYAAVTPSWPDDPETVAEARAHPEVFAGKTLGQVADHTAEVIGGTSARSGAKLWTTRRPQEVRCACR